MKKSLLALPVAWLAVLSCTTTPSGPKWGYEGKSGPSYWGDLSPDYALAKSGRSQSPIDIRTDGAQAGQLPPLSTSYAEMPLDILNNGRTVQVDAPAGSVLAVGSTRWELKQFHFHSPSEHTVDGEHAEIEVHLVHEGVNGDLAVVSVLVEEGASNPFLARIWPHLPRAAGETDSVPQTRVDLDELLPADRASYRYGGSLTTPPCTEGVAWFVLQTPAEASASQVRAFREVLSGNNRPTQPLNGRVVVSNP